MALVHADRVQETTTTTGTGTYTLAGAVAGFQSFAAIGNGNTCYYCATNGVDWEVGLGTYTASGTTLARTSILASTDGGAAVDWGAGTKTVFVTLPAGKWNDVVAHLSNTSNPHSVTKSQVGLGNVTNDAQLKAASNLSDVANIVTARTNLKIVTLTASAYEALSPPDSDTLYFVTP